MRDIDRLTIVQRFASALDRCDFAEAGRYLSPDCHYQLGQQEFVGPEAILRSYRESAEWARHTLEQVIYENAVEETTNGLSILYTDRCVHHGQVHEYHSRQHVWLNDGGQVVKIVHQELPGEREKLDEFFARCGVRR